MDRIQMDKQSCYRVNRPTPTTAVSLGQSTRGSRDEPQLDPVDHLGGLDGWLVFQLVGWTGGCLAGWSGGWLDVHAGPGPEGLERGVGGDMLACVEKRRGHLQSTSRIALTVRVSSLASTASVAAVQGDFFMWRGV